MFRCCLQRQAIIYPSQSQSKCNKYTCAISHLNRHNRTVLRLRLGTFGSVYRIVRPIGAHRWFSTLTLASLFPAGPGLQWIFLWAIETIGCQSLSLSIWRTQFIADQIDNDDVFFSSSCVCGPFQLLTCIKRGDWRESRGKENKMTFHGAATQPRQRRRRWWEKLEVNFIGPSAINQTLSPAMCIKINNFVTRVEMD